MAPLAEPSKQIAGLLGWLAVSFTAAAIGGTASIQASPFYTQLLRPDWAPPPAIFGPVWTVLYALMGIAAWLVWRVGGFRAAKSALSLFLVQLALNALWSWLFFGWKFGALAFADILVLITLVCTIIVAFARIHRGAAVMLLPYLTWISFAAALNFSVWQANPVAL